MDSLLITLQSSALLTSYATFLIIAAAGALSRNPNTAWLCAGLLAMRLIDTYLLIPAHQYMTDGIEVIGYAFWASTAYISYKFILMRPLYSYRIGTWLNLALPSTTKTLPARHVIQFNKTEYLLAQVYGLYVICNLLFIAHYLIKYGLALEFAPGQHQWLVQISHLFSSQTTTPAMAFMVIGRSLNTLLTVVEYSLLVSLILRGLASPPQQLKGHI